MQSSPVRSISCIIDTDVVIDFLRSRDYARRLLENWAGKGLLGISVLTHLEIYQGMKSGEERATNAFLDGCVSFSVDHLIARQAGIMLRDVRSRGITIGMADAIIAATALRFDVPLLTNDIEHYPFSTLKVIRGLE